MEVYLRAGARLGPRGGKVRQPVAEQGAPNVRVLRRRARHLQRTIDATAGMDTREGVEPGDLRERLEQPRMFRYCNMVHPHHPEQERPRMHLEPHEGRHRIPRQTEHGRVAEPSEEEGLPRPLADPPERPLGPDPRELVPHPIPVPDRDAARYEEEI